MDVDRAYARWIRRRLFILSGAAAAAVLLGLHLLLEDDLRSSARVGLLVIVALVVSLLLTVAGLALLCHRLHRARPRGEARGVRRLLEPAERLVAPAVLLLLPVALAPAAFRRPESAAPQIVFRPPAPRERVTSSAPPDVAVTTPASIQAAQPEPVLSEPAPLPLPPLPARPLLPDLGKGSDNDVFRLLREDLTVPEPRITFDRLGVPDDARPLEGRPMTVELDTLVLWEDDGATGSGLSLRLDLPVEGGPLLRLSMLYLGDAGEPDLADGTPEFSLAHTTLDVVFRVWGGTRRAALDLWVSVGLAVDAAEAEGVDRGGRLSPHLALDLALWQTERAGFEFRVGQSIPASLSGGSAAVTDASAAVRIDLSENVSLRAGWRYLVVHLRDYDGAFGSGGVVAELDRDFSGPFIGLEVRF